MDMRVATMDDLDRVLQIIADGKAALAAQGLDQWQAGSPTPAMLEADVRGGHARLAVDGDGTVLGTVSVFEEGEGDYDNVTSGAWLTESANDAARGRVRYVVLHRMAVASEARRRGVASFMLARCLEEARARGFASVRVDTHEGNLPMQHTFEKAGMTRCCEIELSNQVELTKKRIGFEIVL